MLVLFKMTIPKKKKKTQHISQPQYMCINAKNGKAKDKC